MGRNLALGLEVARRTEARTKPEMGGPDQLPPAPPGGEERPFWLGWIALVVVIAVGIGLVVFLSVHSPSKAVPGNAAPPAGPAATPTPSAGSPAVGGVPATSYEAFAALSSAEQQAVMQAAIDHYGAVVADAFQRLNGSSLPQVATGAELKVLQQDLQKAIQYGYPDVDHSQASILGIILSPQLYSFVSLHVRSTGTDQYLDPKTLQPIQAPSPSTGTSTFSFVIESGVWKVSEQIQDSTP